MREETAGFLAIAREELEAAASLLPRHPSQAAFFVQQAAEKLLKAVLTAENLNFPKSHQLGALAALLPGDHPWRADLAALDRLTAYATALRYPLQNGRQPPSPDPLELAGSVREVAALLDEIEPWCRAPQAR